MSSCPVCEWNNANCRADDLDGLRCWNCGRPWPTGDVLMKRSGLAGLIGDQAQDYLAAVDLRRVTKGLSDRVLRLQKAENQGVVTRREYDREWIFFLDWYARNRLSIV